MADENNLAEFNDVLENGGYLVNPSPSVMETVLETDFNGDLRILAESDTVSEVTDNFVLAAHLADSLEDGGLEVREVDDLTDSMYHVANGVLSALIDTGESVEVITTDNEETAQRVYEASSVAFEGANDIRLRVPAYSTIVESMREELGDGMADDFVEAFESIENADSEVDEVALVLLLGARNEVLLYEVSKWGEDIRLASKATFSRVKTRLEDNNLIDTEKVPIDVGRPRLRLKLGGDTNLETTADVVSTVTEQ